MDLGRLTPPELEELAEDLRVARTHIAYGWTQGRMFEPGDRMRVCTLGALTLGCNGGPTPFGYVESPRFERAIMTLLSHIDPNSSRYIRNYDCPSVNWVVSGANDRRDTTQEQVLGWFDAAIAEVRNVIGCTEAAERIATLEELQDACLV